VSRRRKSQISVSLFPFLSVLACVIGTLTLMISALALGQMDTDALASAEQLEKAERALAEVLAEIERLKQQLADVKNDNVAVQEALKKLEEELERIRREKEQAEARLDDPIDVEMPKLDEEAHKKRLEALAADLEEINKQIEALKARIAEKKKPPDEAVVQVRPSGTGKGLKPVFVECTATSAVIHEGDKPHRVPRGALKTDETFLAMLDRVAGQEDATVVFLIRDDGISTYRVASSVATSRYARNGKIPVIGHGKLDLSLFRQ